MFNTEGLELHDPEFYFVVCGPTASGKSAFALALAKQYDGEIICCDSVQVYRGFDIGSAKPTEEEQNEVTHHLFNVVNAHENFDASSYAVKAREIILAIQKRGKIPIVVGGTGLYLRALLGENFHDLPHDAILREVLKNRPLAEKWDELNKLDPERANQLKPNDDFRITRALEVRLLTGKVFRELTQDKIEKPWGNPYVIYLDVPKELLNPKIVIRSQKMLDSGLIDEVKNLLAQGCQASCKPMQSIGYKQVVEFLKLGSLDQNKLLENIVIATRQYAKQQRTWFKKMRVHCHRHPCASTCHPRAGGDLG